MAGILGGAGAQAQGQPQQPPMAMGPGYSTPFMGGAEADPQTMAIEQAARQLAAQGVPPPAPGSLAQMMNDPTLRAAMMGAVQGYDPRDEELKRLMLATNKGGAYVQTALGGGSQYQPTVPGLYAQAAKSRGTPPLGRSLRGG